MKLLSTSCLVLLRSSYAFSTHSIKTTSFSAASQSLLTITPATARRSIASTALNMSAEKPFSVIVEAEIKEDRMEEFKAMIESNAKKSRQEPGCIRFGEIVCGLIRFDSFIHSDVHRRKLTVSVSLPHFISQMFCKIKAKRTNSGFTKSTRTVPLWTFTRPKPITRDGQISRKVEAPSVL